MMQFPGSRRRRRSGAFSPGELFANGEQGAWYDPSDFSTLYQDRAGTTPVTALGQPVGLMLDKANWDGRGVVNLLTRSEAFDQNPPWILFGTSVTADQEVAPDGTTTADLVTATNASPYSSSILGTVTAIPLVVYTYSIYAKAGTSSTIRLRFTDNITGQGQADVNLSTGAVSVFGAGPQNITASSSAVGNGWFRVSVTGTQPSGQTQLGVGAYLQNTGDTVYLWGAQLEVGSTATAYQPNGSVVGGPGNHASQATPTARPTVQARVNLAEGTDSLTGWANQANGITRSYPAVTTPNGIPAVLAQLDTSPGWAVEIVIAKVSGSHVYSVYVKAGTATQTSLLFRNQTTGVNVANIVFSFASPSGNYESLGDGWYRIWVTSSAISAGDTLWLYWYPGNNVVGASAYGAGGQLEEGSTPTTYQRVTTATDYADIGLPRYLEFDGVDDALATASIDFSGTDEMTLIAGLTSEDTGAGIIAELSADISTNNGAFALEYDGSANDYEFSSKGTTLAAATSQALYTEPNTKVVTGVADISGTDVQLRIDGSVVDTNGATQGTGNFGNAALYIAARGGTTVEYDGRIYQMILRGKVTDGALLQSAEAFVGRKAGLTLPDGAFGSFAWDSSTSSPAASSESPYRQETNIHRAMRGCLVLDNGTVNYYLDPDDWSKKADGSASTLTGADGQVMVEIPAFYTRRTKVGTVTTWEIADKPTSGFALHPAFVKDGVTVTHRYVGAYDACYYDDSDSAYESGLNQDITTVDTIDDVLASVAGVYPLVGVTRATCRTLAANRGAGWRQLDYALWNAINLLYLIEYQTFYSQDELGDGNTNDSYFSSSSDQNDSPHTIAGAGDSWGNGSTDGTQASAGAKPGTAYMKYRGIENWYGNCWTFVDGVNLNIGTAGTVYVTNDASAWADDTSTGYTLIASDRDTSSDWITDWSDIDDYFVANESTGGSSSTYVTDYDYGTASLNRVVNVGGSALNGAFAGAFALAGTAVSGYRVRILGARLAR